MGGGLAALIKDAVPVDAKRHTSGLAAEPVEIAESLGALDRDPDGQAGAVLDHLIACFALFQGLNALVGERHLPTPQPLPHSTQGVIWGSDNTGTARNSLGRCGQENATKLRFLPA